MTKFYPADYQGLKLLLLRTPPPLTLMRLQEVLLLKRVKMKWANSYLELTLASIAGGVGSNSQRRASVTVSGSGGLTGLIQSALNQVEGKFTIQCMHIVYDIWTVDGCQTIGHE